ncbi:MAG: galactose mutarotase [Aureliella sp.]
MISKEEFGATPEGNPVTLYTLTNSNGNEVGLIDYGAIITKVRVPDRDGNLANVNVNFPTLDGYLGRHAYLGSTVGRFCNRIAKGKFSLDGAKYDLVINNGPNHLHGGTVGFDKLMWAAEEIESEGACGIRFQTTSPDGQEGYPGTLTLTAEYTFSDKDELAYTFKAETDKSTVINMTNHSYWNLAGTDSGNNVFDHRVQLNCDRYLDVDDTLIPTGKFAALEGTPLDFREQTRIGDRIDQLPATKGYDHCFVINGEPGQLRSAGTVVDQSSGRCMEVLTTQPGVQLYTGNHLGGEHKPYSGLCLETQHYPDSPNREEFPTTRLDPGEKFEETTVHRFYVQ